MAGSWKDCRDQPPSPCQPQPGQEPFGASSGATESGQAPFGAPAPAEASKKKTGLVVGIVVAAVLLVGGGVAAFLLLDGTSDEEKVNEPADQVVTSCNEGDVEPAASISCSKEVRSVPGDMPDNVQLQRDGEITITGDRARVPLSTGLPGQKIELAFEAGEVIVDRDRGTVPFPGELPGHDGVARLHRDHGRRWLVPGRVATGAAPR